MKKLQILVIDDEPIICQTMRLMLNEFGYSTETAENGYIGLELFQNGGFDLVITDLLMPGKSGLDVIKAIKTLSPDTPIIVASGAGKSKDAIDAIKLGAWDYIDKPITEVSILKLTIERVLEKAALLREKAEYQRGLENLILLKTQDLEKTIQELNENKEYLRHILNSISDMIFVTDLTGRVMKINPAASDFLHLTRNEIIDKNIDLLFLKDNNTRILSNSIALLKFKESEIISEMYITVYECTFCFKVTLTQLKPSEEGTQTAAVVVFTDISAYMPGK